MPKCKHEIKIKCNSNPERNIIYPRKCTRTLTCGHKCEGKCGGKCTFKNWKELVLKKNKSLACGHSMWVFCCDKDKGNSIVYK